MGEVKFTRSIGTARAAAAAPLIRSADVLEHALDTAHADAAHKSFSANASHSAEIAKLYNAAVKDGRFIRQLSSHPEQVAKDLNIPLSAAAAGEIKKAGQLLGAHLPSTRPGAGGSNPRAGTVTVVCIAVVVVLCADVGPNADVIVDQSGFVKL